ncbi:MbtH family protein [Streptomyces thermolilacinus]|uniref:MbtH family protein n=1 Tax=Streptomyces thermolilacinus TaxID=285540 RepID=UPI0033F9BC1D
MTQTPAETATDAADSTRYVVVTNHEEQYSLWPAHRELPPGWQARTEPADRGSCLEHIRAHWVDMRPLSLREREQRP